MPLLRTMPINFMLREAVEDSGAVRARIFSRGDYFMYDLNNEPTKSNYSKPLPASRAFASLLSGGILVIGAFLLRGIYHGPPAFPLFLQQD